MIKTFIACTVIVLSVLGIKLGFSSYTPWVNEPAKTRALAREVHLGTDIRYSDLENDSLIMVVTMSGGGTRAGAFAYGVLEALRETKIQWENQESDLFTEIDLISGVSAGSILASYATAYGTQTFPDFKNAFLYKDHQSSLIINALTPTNLMRLTSPNYGRGDLLIEHLNELYEGKTFSDLPARPRLLVTATDLARARSFQFTPEQFALICSDLGTVPLAFAAGASSAVPFIFSPISVKNYSGTEQCKNKTSIYKNPDAPSDFRINQLYLDKMTYLDSNSRPYIHLVDGAVSDNLGLRSILDRVSMGDNINALVRGAPPRSIKRMVFVIINAEIVPLEDIDQTIEVPDILKVASAIRFGKGLRTSAETLELLHQSADLWTEQLKSPEMDNEKSIFSPNSELHVIQVNLRDTPDKTIRSRLMSLATAFYLPRAEVDALIDAGKKTLLASPDFQKMLRSLSPK